MIQDFIRNIANMNREDLLIFCMEQNITWPNDHFCIPILNLKNLIICKKFHMTSSQGMNAINDYIRIRREELIGNVA